MLEACICGEGKIKPVEESGVTLCHGLIHADQVLSDVPQVECLMHNIKFTYLKLFEVT